MVGQIFSGHLRMVLLLMGVDRLGEGMEFRESIRFADAGDFILDSGWKSAIQLWAEGGIAPLDLGSEAVEVDEVLHDALVVTHAEILKVSLGFAFGVVQSKVIFQFSDKVRVVVEPG